jgi:hypothetical protein
VRAAILITFCLPRVWSQDLPLSPEARQAASILRIEPQIDQLLAIPPAGRTSPRALALRQQISEAALLASLQIQGVQAEIDRETAQIREIRQTLESDRDRDVAIATLAALIAGTGVGVVAQALQLRPSTDQLGNEIALGAGSASTALSLLTILFQRGDKETLAAPNMLAPFLGQPLTGTSSYPPVVWDYLNSVPAGVPIHETWREQLLDEWKKFGRLNPNGSHYRRRIELLTSGIGRRRRLSIDLLLDREAMLADVRARVGLMNRELAQLLAYLSP